MSSDRKKNTKSFHEKCKELFLWANYQPHTKFHKGRYPLIGVYRSWQRLADCLEFEIDGEIPRDDGDEGKQHVLDIITWPMENMSEFPLVKTDMFTIVLTDATNQSNRFPWVSKLALIRGSLAVVDFEKMSHGSAADDEKRTSEETDNNDIDQLIHYSANNHDTSPSAKSQKSSKTKNGIIRLTYQNTQNGSKGMDPLSVIFTNEVLGTLISQCQETQVRLFMIGCGAIIYNNNLERNDPPDGYYLCNAETLARLKERLHQERHLLATEDIFDAPLGCEYVLLTVEVKASMDCLQSKLEGDYYILRPTPPSIRQLIIVSGGRYSLTWLFLINLSYIDSPSRVTTIDKEISQISRRFAEKIRESHTHIVHLPSFCSEFFRQDPLTKNHLNFLCYLINIRPEVRFCPEAHQNDALMGKVLQKMNHFVAQHSPSQFRPRMYDGPLRDPATASNHRLLAFLEELAVSLVREDSRITNKKNQNNRTRFPKVIKNLVYELRPQDMSRQSRRDRKKKRTIAQTNLLQDIPYSYTVCPVALQDDDEYLSSSISNPVEAKNEEKPITS